MTESIPARPDRTWLYVGLGLVALWFLVLQFYNPMSPSIVPTLDGGREGMPADYSWRLLDLDDKPASLESFRGKTVFLNIWATWCGPCVREMPSIARLAADPRVKDVVFLCVSTDDAAAPVKSFIQGKNWPMTFLRAQDLPEAFATEGIPATFLIGPDGKIASSQIGSVDWDHPSVVSELETLSKR